MHSPSKFYRKTKQNISTPSRQTILTYQNDAFQFVSPKSKLVHCHGDWRKHCVLHFTTNKARKTKSLRNYPILLTKGGYFYWHGITWFQCIWSITPASYTQQELNKRVHPWNPVLLNSKSRQTEDKQLPRSSELCPHYSSHNTQACFLSPGGFPY